MTKGDKLIRSMRQILEMNRQKLRDKIGMCAIARHLTCFIMTKTWLDGKQLSLGPDQNNSDTEAKKEVVSEGEPDSNSQAELSAEDENK
jgi:hypothetical protein